MDESTLRTSTEQKLGAIWSQVLGDSIDDRRLDFFRCGGDSLLATMVALHVRRLLGVEITPQLIFTCPILADLSHRIDTLRGEAESLPA